MRALRPWWSTIALLFLWQVLASAGVLDHRVLPGPSDLAAAAGRLLAEGALQEALAVSTVRAAAGAGIGVVIGLAAGLGAGVSRLVHDVVDRPVQALRTIPFTALTPLLIVWFGLGETPKVLLVTIAVAVPVYLTALGGVRGVDPALVEIAHSFGASRWRTMRAVVLPGAMGPVLVGLRFALGIAWVALIVAEMVNAEAGIGQLLINARTYGRTDVVMLCVAVYAGLGLLTDLLVRLAEARLLRWRSTGDDPLDGPRPGTPGGETPGDVASGHPAPAGTGPGRTDPGRPDPQQTIPDHPTPGPARAVLFTPDHAGSGPGRSEGHR